MDDFPEDALSEIEHPDLVTETEAWHGKYTGDYYDPPDPPPMPDVSYTDADHPGLVMQGSFFINGGSDESPPASLPPEPDIPYTDSDYIADLDVIFPRSGDLNDDELELVEYEALLAVARSAGNPQREEQVLGKIGDHYWLRAYSISVAIEWLNQQGTAAEAIQDGEDNTKTLLNQVRVYARLACDYYAQQLTIAHAIHGYEDETTALSWMAMAYSTLGETQQAIACQERRLAIYREQGDRWGHIGAALNDLIELHTQCGDLERADAYREQRRVLEQRHNERRAPPPADGEDFCTEQQERTIRALLPRAGISEAELTSSMHVSTIGELPRTRAAKVIDRLNAKARERAQQS